MIIGRTMKIKLLLAGLLLSALGVPAQTYQFDMTKSQPNYTDQVGYGYDVVAAPEKKDIKKSVNKQTSLDLDFEVKTDEIIATCAVNTLGKTGVEMEAITGVSVALLTVWDMVKAVEKDDDGQYPDTRISDIKVIKKEKI